MDTRLAESINTFGISPKADFPVSPAEQTIAVPAALLQDLLSEVSQLREEIATLRDERARDRAEFERFKAAHKAFAVRTTKDLDALFEANLKPTATPETTKKPAQKTQDNITRIAVILGNKEKNLIQSSAPKPYLLRLRKEGMTFSQLANIMGLTVDRIRQLAKLAAGDQRFNITWHPRKKNTKIFKLRRWDAPGL